MLGLKQELKFEGGPIHQGKEGSILSSYLSNSSTEQTGLLNNLTLLITLWRSEHEACHRQLKLPPPTSISGFQDAKLTNECGTRYTSQPAMIYVVPSPRPLLSLPLQKKAFEFMFGRRSSTLCFVMKFGMECIPGQIFPPKCLSPLSRLMNNNSMGISMIANASPKKNASLFALPAMEQTFIS